MKLLVTGASGFIGKNLIAELKNRGFDCIFEWNRTTTKEEAILFLKECDFIFHLAGVNRPKEEKELIEGNSVFTAHLVEQLIQLRHPVPVVMTSSIQAERENLYGKSKKEGEIRLLEYGVKEQVPVFIYRLSNVFGKWGKPYYNSVITTFCHQLARNESITIHDRQVPLQLQYIDDVVGEFISLLNKRENKEMYGNISVCYESTVGEIATILTSFQEARRNGFLPTLQTKLEQKLYSTYLSYLPDYAFSYPLKQRIDERGSFTEFLKTQQQGQISINRSKPGIVKGNHWHQSKHEKFLVVSGEGVIQLRKLQENKLVEYYVSGEKLEVVEIPPGYIHTIKNLGEKDLITVIWANEVFDSHNMDTYPEVI